MALAPTLKAGCQCTWCLRERPTVSLPRDTRAFTEGLIQVDQLWLVWLLAMANLAILKYLLLGWWPT